MVVGRTSDSGILVQGVRAAHGTKESIVGQRLFCSVLFVWVGEGGEGGTILVVGLEGLPLDVLLCMLVRFDSRLCTFDQIQIIS